MNENTKCGFVALIGAPNSGKSTITNHFVGSKVSIVSPKVQTTRTTIKGIGVWNNTQIIFLDTPGIFKPKRRLDRAMVANAWDGSGDADIVVLVVDARSGINDQVNNIISELQKKKQSAVLLINKIDLVKKDKLLELSAQLNSRGQFAETFFVSAINGKNMDMFYDYLADNLPDSPWYYPEEQMSDMPLKLLAAEIVREKLFLYLQQEIPYELTVEPELWEHHDDGSIKAEITIYVKKDNQKIIILGKGGQMIKKIGSSARREIETMLENRFHLFLFVKVRENWQEDAGRYSLWGLNFKS